MKVGYIQTKFWNDSYIQSLSPSEKLLFLYLRTNSHYSICGIYEITDKTISFETGISIKEIKSFLLKFHTDNKILRCNNWIKLVNVSKNLYKSNDNLVKGIENELGKIPADIQAVFEGVDKPLVSPLLYPRTITPSPSPSPSPTINTEEEIYKFYLSEIKPDPKYNEPSISKSYIKELLREYSKEQLMNSISNYKKNKQASYTLKPSNFFSNSKRKDKYRIFENYLDENVTSIENQNKIKIGYDPRYAVVESSEDDIFKSFSH